MKRFVQAMFTILLFCANTYATTETLGIDVDYLDLDTGQVDLNQPSPPANNWDVVISQDFNSGNYYVEQNTVNWVYIGHITGTSYASVGWSDAINTPLDAYYHYDAFDDGRVVIIQTENARFFKLGNAVVNTNNWTMQFEYEELFPPAPPARDEYLGIDGDYFDLDADTIQRDEWGSPPATPWDVKIATDGGLSPNPFYMEQNTSNWLSIAIVANTYSNVTWNDVTTAFWDSMTVHQSFDDTMTVLIMTDQGRYFKLGNAWFDNWYWRVHFDYEEMLPPPPPTRDEYLGIWEDYLDLDNGQVDRQQPSPPATQWDVRMLEDGMNPGNYYVEQNTGNWLSIAHITGTTYENVSFNDAMNAYWDTNVVTTAFDSNTTVLVLTNDYRYFKLGNAYFDNFYWRMYFDYEELLPPAPPTRDEYLGIWEDYLDLDNGQVDRQHWGAAPTTPWDVRISEDTQNPGNFYVEQNTGNWLNIAHISGTTYENVTFTDAMNASWTSNIDTTVFDANTTVVITTDMGRTFKLGNAWFDAYNWRIYFNYEEMFPPPPPSRVEYLTIWEDYLDLDSGLVDRQQWSGPPATPWDVRIAEDSMNPGNFYVEQNTGNWLNIAHVSGITYENVSFNETTTASWTSAIDTTHFDGNTVLLVMTDQGQFYKLGNPYFDTFSWQIHFDYEQLVPPPPPTRDEYLTIWEDYLDLDSGQVDRQQWSGPPVTPWDVRIAEDTMNPGNFYVEQNTNNWVSIAHVTGTTYANVIFDDVTTAMWDSNVVTTHFDTNTTVLIMTDQGRFFKLGNAYFDSFGWQLYFDYEELLPPPPPARDEYLAVWGDYLDLDNGQVDRQQGSAPYTTWDVHMAEDTQNPGNFYVEQNTTNWVNIAHVTGTAYASVDFNDAMSAMWNTSIDTTPFDVNTTVLIMTDQGRYFKLGNAYFDNFYWEMHFDYEELLPPPPPTRDEYLGIEADYLDLDNGNVDRDQWGMTPTTTWDLRIMPDWGYVDTFYVEQKSGLQIAHLPGATYANVTMTDAQNATWTSAVDMTAFDNNMVVLIYTDQGRTFKLGNPYFDAWTWRIYFDYSEL